MKFFNWTLTFQFVVLALCVYIALTSLSLFLFNRGINEALDDQLELLLAEQSQLIDFNNNKLTWFARDSIGFQSQSLQLRQASYQLFDSSGQLLGAHGTYQCATLFPRAQEVRGQPFTYRTKSVPLVIDDQLVGYLQVELPTTERDELMMKYAITICGVTLLGFGLLSVAGYNYSREAAKPIFDSYEMLKQFSTDVAHELNTPISTIRATAENMSEELNEPEALKTRLDVLNRALDRMNVIVKDLMLLTRLGMESEKPTKEPEAIDLKKLVTEVVEEFQGRFQQKSIALKSKVDGNPTVMGHSDPLHRMLANLLENALRYTDSNGEVNVDLACDHNAATITVSDTGIGIPEESVSKIFDRFYRVDKARAREQGGSGLGLSIVQAITVMHNAQIDVQSELGKGTKFTVSIPVAKSKS